MDQSSAPTGDPALPAPALRGPALEQQLHHSGRQLAVGLLPSTPLLSAIDALQPLCTDLIAHLADHLEALWLARPGWPIAVPCALGPARVFYLGLADAEHNVMVDLADLALLLLQTSGPRPDLTYAMDLQRLGLLSAALSVISGEASTAELRRVRMGLSLVQHQARRIVQAWDSRLRAWLDDPAVDHLPPSTRVVH